MGFLSSMFLRPRAATGATDDSWYYPGGSYYGLPRNAGSLMGSADGAMRQMTVNNCVRFLYNCVSQMPCQLMEESVDEKKSKAKKHPLYSVISRRPNPWTTAPQFWGMAIAHISLRGNFYAYKHRVGKGIVALYPLNPDRLTVRQDKDWNITYILNHQSGGRQEYTPDDIFHLRGLSLDGIKGLNPIEYARICLENGLSSEHFINRYFSRGMHPGAIITHPFPMDPKELKNMQEAMQELYGGLGKSHELMLLEKDTSIAFPPMKLVDQQFIEQQRFTEAQIAGMYGVPLGFIQAGEHPDTYASASEHKRTFIDMTLVPIAVNFEASINQSLLLSKDQDKYYAKFNLNMLYRGNIIDRYKAYQIGINTEMLNPNECRQLEDLAPYDGGDEYRTRTATVKQDGGAGAGKED